MITYATRPCRHCAGTGLEPDPKLVGAQMKKLRESAGRSIKDVAKKLGMSGQYIYDLESGNRPFKRPLLERYIMLLK